jgi:ABC-type lipoprotein export system ATPase subunit
MSLDYQMSARLRDLWVRCTRLATHWVQGLPSGTVADPQGEQTATAMIAQADRAARSLAEDRLGRRPFVNRLVGALIDEKTGRATGVVVGIVGEWGSGKSSILNMLDGAIHDAYRNNALVIRFDPWLVSGRDDLITQFLRQLQDTIAQDSKLKQRLKKLADIFQKYGKAVAPVAEASWPGSKIVIDILQKLRPAKMSLHDQRLEIESVLSSVDLPIVVLIDELDRVDDDEVRAVAQLVRSVMDFPRISYVLAYDDERVAEALGQKDAKRGQVYLEKIVQFPIPLPLATGSEIRNLFEAQLVPIIEDIGIDPPLDKQERYDELIKLLIPDILKTPRDIKRVLGMYHVLAGMIWEEVDNVDLLAFTALMSKAPQTEKLIRGKYSFYIQDGWRDEDYDAYWDEAEQKLEDRQEARIAKDDRSPSLDRLMGFLFPQLASERRRDDVAANSLCRYRPLVTVLRLGLLPGDYPSAAVRALLAQPANEILKFMEAEVQTREFGNLWQRLWDIYLSDEFDDIVHRTFWDAMRQFVLKHDNQWPTHYAAMRDVVEAVSDLFEKKFLTDDENVRELGLVVLNELTEKGDVEIVPSFLRSHFFAYGLFGRQQRAGVRTLLTEDETTALAERIAKREIPRLLGGDLLKSVWMPHVIFLIRDVGDGLDEECRSYFDSLVQNDETLPAVSLFFNGPTFGSDAGTLEKFFDLAKLKARAQEKLNLDESGELSLEPSVKLSYKKTADPMF